MKKIICLIIVVIMCSCSTFRPRGFEHKFDGKNTGLDTLIDINGYYQPKVYFVNRDGVQRPYQPALSFYSNGIVCFTANKDASDVFTNIELAEHVATWGAYIISSDTIKVQFISNYGLMAGGYYANKYYFKIKSFNEIERIKTERHDEFFKGVKFSFYPLENRIDSTNWLLKKKWFYKKK